MKTALMTENKGRFLVALFVLATVVVLWRTVVPYFSVSESIARKDAARLRLLHRLGADLCKPDARGFLPLGLAAESGSVETVRVTLDSGCKVDSVTNNGFTPLMGTAMEGDTAMISLLLQRGAKIDAQDTSGNTALMLAARRGNVNAIKLLLARGANPSLKDRYGRTARTHLQSALHLQSNRDNKERQDLLQELP